MPPPNRSLDESSLRSAWRAMEAVRREAVLVIANRLRAEGFRAWLVGGAVRDLALGRCVGDLDMVSAATPDQALALFPFAREIGKSFGIVQVDVANESIELATFRLEEGYHDGRHPDSVRFTDSLELDAKRRDFTCNALYFDPLEEVLSDPTDGLADLRLGRLCTVGEPHARFAEDGLRLLRVARFLARLGLEPGQGLLAAARAAKASLRGVSAERIFGEFERMASGPRADRAFWALLQAELLGPAFFVGELDLLPESAERLETLRCLLGAMDPPGIVAWLVLGLDPEWREPKAWANQREDLLVRMRTLKVPRSEQAQVLSVCQFRREWRHWQLPRDAAALVRCLRTPEGKLALLLARADAQAAKSDAEVRRLNFWFDWLESLPSDRVFPSFLPDGKDLIKLGATPGPELGTALEAIESAALEGTIHTRQVALDWARSLLGLDRPKDEA